VDEVFDAVQRDLAHRWTLEEMAARVRLSTSRLRFLTQAVVGLPPRRYLKQLRLEEARRLLLTSRLSVKEAAWAVGLTDDSHFIREFGRAFGSPPGRLAKANRRVGQETGNSANRLLVARRLSQD
jgi:AraC-like DNA-binding protein